MVERKLKDLYIRLVLKLDKIITPLIMKLIRNEQTKRLIDRRQGYIAHFKLEKRFREIGRDLYVMKARRSR